MKARSASQQLTDEQGPMPAPPGAGQRVAHMTAKLTGYAALRGGSMKALTACGLLLFSAPAAAESWILLDSDTDKLSPDAWPVSPGCALEEDGASCVTLRADVIAGYRRGEVGDDSVEEFALDRAEAGLGLVWRGDERFDGGVSWQVEAIRSAGPQSLIGVDGDALVLRALGAYGHGAAHLGPIDLGLRLGLVPERWLEQLNKGYDLRGVDTLMSDRTYFNRSDLGATFTVSAFTGRLELDVEYVNGEGQTQREQNAGKNLTVMLTARPLMSSGPDGMTLALHAAYRDGSVGVASARDHRAAGAVTFASRYAFAGVEYARAMGMDAQPLRESQAFSFWASGHVLAPYLGVLLKLDRVDQDMDTDGAHTTQLTAGVFSDLFPHADRQHRRLRLHVAYQREAYGDAAGPLPGAPDASLAQALLVTLQASGLHRF